MKIYAVIEQSLFPDSSYREIPKAFSTIEKALDFVKERQEMFKTDLEQWHDDFGGFTYHCEEDTNKAWETGTDYTIYGKSNDDDSYSFYTRLSVIPKDVKDGIEVVYVAMEEENSPKQNYWAISDICEKREDAVVVCSCCSIDSMNCLEKGYWTYKETGIDVDNHKIRTEYDAEKDGEWDCNSLQYIFDTETLYYIAWSYYGTIIQ